MATATEERYQQEREKRLTSHGLGQYLDQNSSAKYGFNVDPWIEAGTPVHRPVPDGKRCKIIIFGAGFAGLLAAARCLEKGAAKNVDDILIVDPAGGFGGTWWWNRFPGLMCDVESYIYLPLLEETGYMPKRKYASGEEIRAYADLVARQYHLTERAMFQSKGQALTWETDHWVCGIVESPKGLPESKITVKADYVILACGLFTYPKLPDVAGLEAFQGEMLHTARWNYDVTGGAPSNPTLNGLSGKKVALVGTGATAIQTVPAVAPYAGQLSVFQRTPASVDVRNNRDTLPSEWESNIASKKGWQRERMDNFQAHVENWESLPEEDLVNDAFTKMPSIAAGSGTPRSVTLDAIAQYIELMHKLDLPRQERIRQRVLNVVENQDTAKRLQAWYPGWCKRACVHDEYLSAFNNPNVHLVDTEGQGIEAITPTGIIVQGKEHAADVIIWSTGYGNPGTESAAGKAGMRVTGRDGSDMESLHKQGDFNTLHGIVAHKFPNLFFFGLAQAAIGPNQTQRMDGTSEQIAYIISAAERKTASKRTVLEPTAEACESWASQIASHAHMLAAMSGCTPSYLNMEGEVDRWSPEQMMKAARNGVWGQGFTAYSKILSEWRARGDLQGLKIKSV